MQIKLLTIGDSAVGKTCLLLRYASDQFQTSFITTIGIDFKTKDVHVEGRPVRLQIWDTAGQERFRTITTSYFNGAHGIMLVYDVCDRASFNSIRNWVDQIRQHADIHVNMILVGNKCDLKGPDPEQAEGEAAPMGAGQGAVTHAEGAALAAEYGVRFFETSAKDNIRVEDAFFTLAQETTARICKQERPSRPRGQRLREGGDNGRGSRGCC
eukprot:g7478.t1